MKKEVQRIEVNTSEYIHSAIQKAHHEAEEKNKPVFMWKKRIDGQGVTILKGVVATCNGTTLLVSEVQKDWKSGTVTSENGISVGDGGKAPSFHELFDGKGLDRIFEVGPEEI